MASTQYNCCLKSNKDEIVHKGIFEKYEKISKEKPVYLITGKNVAKWF